MGPPSWAPITVPMIMLSRAAWARRAMLFCRCRCACVAGFFFFLGSSAGVGWALDSVPGSALAVFASPGAGAALESLGTPGAWDGAGFSGGGGALAALPLSGCAAPGTGFGPEAPAHARLAQSSPTSRSFGASVHGLRMFVRGLSRNSTSADRIFPHGPDRHRETLA